MVMVYDSMLNPNHRLADLGVTLVKLIDPVLQVVLVHSQLFGILTHLFPDGEDHGGSA